MELSLTKKQFMERLSSPQRLKLLRLAINESYKDILPIRVVQPAQQEGQHLDISIDISKELTQIGATWIVRAVELVFDDSLD